MRRRLDAAYWGSRVSSRFISSSRAVRRKVGSPSPATTIVGTTSFFYLFGKWLPDAFQFHRVAHLRKEVWMHCLSPAWPPLPQPSSLRRRRPAAPAVSAALPAGPASDTKRPISFGPAPHRARGTGPRPRAAAGQNWGPAFAAASRRCSSSSVARRVVMMVSSLRVCKCRAVAGAPYC